MMVFFFGMKYIHQITDQLFVDFHLLQDFIPSLSDLLLLKDFILCLSDLPFLKDFYKHSKVISFGWKALHPL